MPRQSTSENLTKLVETTAARVSSSSRPRLLLAMLSVIAGSADVTSFLGLGLFCAHVTGNLVILAAHVMAQKTDNACLIDSVLLFILVLALTRLLVAGMEALDIRSLQPLLLVQFILLAASFVLGIAFGDHPDAEARGTVAAGQLCVAAMAVQNALVYHSSRAAPSTTVMSPNLTRFIMDAGESILGHKPADADEARRRAKETLPVIIGFSVGAVLGAACFAAAGRKSLGLPAGLALLALIMSLTPISSGRKQ
jgi:uncharacterized membrane protein YoaK (UPF0700 family)